MKKLFVFALALGMVLGVSMTAGADSFFDNFNRADASDLGPNWTVNGSIGISGNRAASTVQDSNYATVNGFSDSYLTTKLAVDAVNPSAFNYTALMLGYADADHNLFVKVQVQGGTGGYNYAAFYYGNNLAGSFFGITPFDAGRISVYAIDTWTVQLDIDSNFDGFAEQTYTHPYTAAEIAGLGTGIGLGMYGAALADNYAANNVVPIPGAAWLLGSGLLGLAGWRRLKKG
jgi:hypothetical protein